MSCEEKQASGRGQRRQNKEQKKSRKDSEGTVGDEDVLRDSSPEEGPQGQVENDPTQLKLKKQTLQSSVLCTGVTTGSWSSQPTGSLELCAPAHSETLHILEQAIQ